MAVSSNSPRTLVVRTLIVLAACYSMPASAATSNAILCKEAAQATLELHERTLTANAVAHEISVTKLDDEESPPQHLAPRAEQAIRDAFRDSPLISATHTAPLVGVTSTTESDESEDETDEETPTRNAKLPGVSEAELLLYKKQMYRRDI